MEKDYYRGLEKDSYSWVYGYHVSANGKEYISFPLDDESINVGSPGTIDVDLDLPIDLFTLAPFAEVLPESLGQATGKEDRNHVMIYDKDIIKISGGSNYYAKVEYDENCACYFAVNYDVQLPVELSDLKSQFLEVVGNTVDNPDMIE